MNNHQNDPAAGCVGAIALFIAGSIIIWAILSVLVFIFSL
jgi:hypothetical protein